jgi:protein-S-isoprenylcysteine O-methyltransferase Ste14
MRGLASLLGFLVMVAALAALFLKHAVLSPAPLVIVLQLAAIVVMLWARITFGRRSFHPTAGATAGGVVTSGPYQYIRHPIYASVCLFVWASSLGHLSPFSVAMACIATAGAMIRLVAEEGAMRRRYPEYDAYAATTKRLVPFIY